MAAQLEQCLVSSESRGRNLNKGCPDQVFWPSSWDPRQAERSTFSISCNLGTFIFAQKTRAKWPFNTIQQDFCANIQIEYCEAADETYNIWSIQGIQLQLSLTLSDVTTTQRWWICWIIFSILIFMLKVIKWWFWMMLYDSRQGG